MDIDLITKNNLPSIQRQLQNTLRHRQMLIIELAQYLSQSFSSQNQEQSPSLFAKKVTVVALMNAYFRTYYSELSNNEKALRFAQFRNHIILNKNLNFKTLDLLADSFKVVFTQLGQYFLETTLELWDETPLFQKILILQNILCCQLPKNQLINFFVRKILYITESADILLKDTLQNPSLLQKNSVVLIKCLSVIYNCLKYLKECKDKEDHLALISKSQLNFLIFQRIMLLSHKQTREGIIQYDFQRFEIVFLSQNKKLDQIINKLKSICLDIQSLILKDLQTVAFTQGVCEQYLTVGKVKKVLPAIVQTLQNYHLEGVCGSKQTTRSIKQDQNYSEVIQSALNYIQAACIYPSIISFLIQKTPTLLFTIIYPLMQLENQEQLNFFQDPDLFIGNTNFLIQQCLDGLEDEPTCTVKNAAASLLNKFTLKYQTTHGLLYQVLLDMLCYQQLQKSQNLQQMLLNHKITPIKEQIYLILSIVGNYIFSDAKYYKNVKNIITRSKVQTWDSIEIFRLLTFINQFFTSIFPETEQAQDLVRKIAGKISTSKSVQKQFLTFFEDNIYNLGSLGQEMWFSIIKQIKNSQNASFFQCIRRIIQKVSCWQLSEQVVHSVVGDTCKRILCQIKSNSTNKQIVYKCLNLLRAIVKSQGPDKPQNAHPQYFLARHQKVAEHVWSFLFELLPYAQQANIQQQSLIILKKMLQIQPKLVAKHFSYVQQLNSIPFSKPIFKVYEIYVQRVQLLVQKDLQVFTCMIFENLLDKIQQVWRAKDLEGIQGILNALYCMLIKYFDVISRKLHEKANEKINVCLNHSYQINSDSFCKAAFINVLVLGQITDNKLYQNGMKLLQDENIVIFRDYQAKMLANTLSFTVQKYGRQMPQTTVCIICKILIRLLHYQRFLINEACNLPQQRKIKKERNQFKMKIKGIDAIDVFRQGKIGFDAVRSQLRPEEYQQIIQQIQRENISQNQLQQLISAIQIKGKYRKIIKAKRLSANAFHN